MLMKKILLSCIGLATMFVASAAIPDFSTLPSTKASFDIKQEKATFVNPVSWDNSGANWYLTGTFNDSFEIKGTTYEAVGTSSYIIKYDAYSAAPTWCVVLKGAATIKAIDVDSKGNVYIAGTLADEVEFGTTAADGEPIVAKGLFENDEAVSYQDASFVACYSSAGVPQVVKTFVPARLEQLADGWDNAYFRINGLKVVGSKVYCSAVYTGSTKVGEASFDGTCANYFGFMMADESNASVFTLATKTLDECTEVASIEINETREIASNIAAVRSIAFDVASDSLYVGFTGSGNMKVTVGNASYDVDADNENEEMLAYSIASEKGIYTLRNNSAPYHGTGKITAVMANSIYVYAVGSYEDYLPAAEITDAAKEVVPAGVSDLFVMRAKLSGMTDGVIMPYSHDTGTTQIGEDEKSTYEESTSAFLVNGAVYVNSIVYDYNQTALRPESYWCDNGEYSAAPVALTGAAKFIDDEHPNFPISMILAQSDANAASTMWARYKPVEDKEIETAITEIGSDNADAPVEYYNLQGIRVAEPVQGGVYIRRQGSSVEKILVK